MYKFKTIVEIINKQILIRIPLEIDLELPSRGLVMVSGSLNGLEFTEPLEPDGGGSHWMALDQRLIQEIHLKPGDRVTITLEPAKNWIEPSLPKDLAVSLIDHNQMMSWEAITVKARWEWIRWIRFTKNPTTRAKRIQTAMDMLSKGKKRPCCFDQSRCTITEVAKNGVLLH